MNGALSRRVATAFNIGKPLPEDRAHIVREVQKVETFSELPDKIQQLIESLEDGKAGIMDEDPT